MDESEIDEMARLEGSHWWYRGLRHMIERTLRMSRFALPHGARVLDAGCGTGENMLLLQQLLRPSYVGGFDISTRAVALCRQKIGPHADVYVSDIQNPIIHAQELDLIISCDVITIAGLEASKAGLMSLVAKLRRGGVFIFNLAALRWLYSAHDVNMAVRDRANAGDLSRLMIDIGLQVEFMTYRLFWLFPLVLLRRLPSMLFRPRPETARSDLAPVAPWINESLYRSVRAENWMACRGIRFPWGSSLYAVGRKDRAL